jgi:predicted metal-binding membrane protein
MSEMQMAGGWTMSMMWMRAPGQTWLGAAASFVGMWIVMMAPMMAPSFTPVLWRYAQAARGVGERGVGRLTALVAAAYLFVWAAMGAVVFPLGAALLAIAMHEPLLAHAQPVAVGVALMIAGALQFTSWKAQQLALCRQTPGHGDTVPVHLGAVLRYGLCVGLRCTSSCAGLTAVMLLLGFMDVRVIIVVASAITAERLAPAGVAVARAVGGVVIGGGLYLTAVAMWLG